MSRLYCDPKSRMTMDSRTLLRSAARRAAAAAAQLSSPGSRWVTTVSLKRSRFRVDGSKLASCYMLASRNHIFVDDNPFEPARESGSRPEKRRCDCDAHGHIVRAER